VALAGDELVIGGGRLGRREEGAGGTVAADGFSGAIGAALAVISLASGLTAVEGAVATGASSRCAVPRAGGTFTVVGLTSHATAPPSTAASNAASAMLGRDVRFVLFDCGTLATASASSISVISGRAGFCSEPIASASSLASSAACCGRVDISGAKQRSTSWTNPRGKLGLELASELGARFITLNITSWIVSPPCSF
jgi:hypothetical protein